MIWLNFFLHNSSDRLQERRIPITIALVTLKIKYNSTYRLIYIIFIVNKKYSKVMIISYK